MKISEINISYSNKNKQRIKIDNSRQSYQAFFNCWSKGTIELQEEFKVLLLNRNNELLGVYSLSKGGVASTVVDAKLLFSVALKANASNIIVGHNHPSGNLIPSESDKRLTKKLKKAGKLLDILLLDHLIISKNDFFSFANHNLL